MSNEKKDKKHSDLIADVNRRAAKAMVDDDEAVKKLPKKYDVASGHYVADIDPGKADDHLK